ncbi:hypothetical protein ACROYT_G000973 [Oculina patagonica]
MITDYDCYLFCGCFLPWEPKLSDWPVCNCLYQSQQQSVNKATLSSTSKNSLNDYGYISPRRIVNHDVSTAIKRFQKFYAAGIKVSGKLDDSTIRLMKKPPCGVCADRVPACQRIKDGGKCNTFPVQMKYWYPKTCYNCIV